MNTEVIQLHHCIVACAVYMQSHNSLSSQARQQHDFDKQVSYLKS